MFKQIAKHITKNMSDYDEQLNELKLKNDKLACELSAAKVTTNDTVEKLHRVNLENKDLKAQLDKFEDIKKHAISYTELDRQYKDLKTRCSNQLDYIWVLQTLGSSKTDKMAIRRVFGHNLGKYIKENYKSVKEASEAFGINVRTVNDWVNCRRTINIDNFDLLDSKLCEYFECNARELLEREF